MPTVTSVDFFISNFDDETLTRKVNMNGVEILPFDKKEFARLSLIFLLTAKTAFVGPFFFYYFSPFRLILKAIADELC